MNCMKCITRTAFGLSTHLHKKHGKPLDTAIYIAQRILDRIIFIAFCEDRELLPARCIDRPTTPCRRSPR